MKAHKTLSQTFFKRPTEKVAQELLGKILISTVGDTFVAGIISETEVYGDHTDAASHAASGTITKRNYPMFGPVGHTYVYKSYGMHTCLNIVARDSGTKAGAILIRSIVPLEGLETIKERRAINNVRLLTNGPGKLGQALGLTLQHNNINVTHPGLLYVIDNKDVMVEDFEATPRIGISRNATVLWRFVATIRHF